MREVTVRTILSVLALLIVACAPLHTQTAFHPWHAVDRGGGKSTSNGITLRSSVGQPAIHAGIAAGYSLESGFIPGARQLVGTTTTFVAALEQNWNMVSVPLLVPDYAKATLFPEAISEAFSYTNRYSPQPMLANGVGYWIKFPSVTTAEITGTSFELDTIDVLAKWNLIGLPSYPVLVTDITEFGTTILSSFFGYTAADGYFDEDTLKPGKAYWVKVAQNGTLVLPTSSMLEINEPLSVPAGNSPTLLEGFAARSPLTTKPGLYNRIIIRDSRKRERSLYFTEYRHDINTARFELPPTPPTGVLDVRYRSERYLEMSEPEARKVVDILISNAEYPIVVSWNMAETVLTERYSLQLDGCKVPMNGEGSVRVNTAVSLVQLQLEPASVAVPPKQYALHQNYPNPFNPSTQIQYDLPVDSHVMLKVYNAIGQEIETLFHGTQKAGFQEATWSASNRASGIYFFRLDATNYSHPTERFSDVRKMLLLR